MKYMIPFSCALALWSGSLIPAHEEARGREDADKDGAVTEGEAAKPGV